MNLFIIFFFISLHFSRSLAMRSFIFLHVLFLYAPLLHYVNEVAAIQSVIK